MNISYNWEIEELLCVDSEFGKIVKTIKFHVTGTSDDGYTYCWPGLITFPENLINYNNIIDYNILTKEIVVGWLSSFSEINEAVVNATNFYINEQKNNISNSLPW
jgi:hypothetical protein